MPKIKHECGIAFLRLRKPLQYYIDKYKTPSYPVGKMFLMMQQKDLLIKKLQCSPSVPYQDIL